MYATFPLRQVALLDFMADLNNPKICNTNETIVTNQKVVRRHVSMNNFEESPIGMRNSCAAYSGSDHEISSVRR